MCASSVVTELVCSQLPCHPRFKASHLSSLSTRIANLDCLRTHLLLEIDKSQIQRTAEFGAYLDHKHVFHFLDVLEANLTWSSFDARVRMEDVLAYSCRMADWNPVHFLMQVATFILFLVSLIMNDRLVVLRNE